MYGKTLKIRFGAAISQLLLFAARTSNLSFS